MFRIIRRSSSEAYPDGPDYFKEKADHLFEKIFVQLFLTPPRITRYLPRQSGQDNVGIGYTEFGERFLLKSNNSICVAEFVGATLCAACGIPVAHPTIVSFKGKEIFGSRLESGVELPHLQHELVDMVARCGNPKIFSAVLAIDLALGNDDRHWHNWLPQPQTDGTVIMRAVDFSRAWPTVRPPHTFASMRTENTGKTWAEWAALNIGYDSISALGVCSTLATLDSVWLDKIFRQLPTEWMVNVDGPALLDWWRQNWSYRIKSMELFLNSGAWK